MKESVGDEKKNNNNKCNCYRRKWPYKILQLNGTCCRTENKLPLTEDRGQTDCAINAWPWPMTLAFNPWQAVAIARMQPIKVRQRSDGSEDKVETDGWTDGIDCSSLPCALVAWHSGRTSVSDWRTFPVLRSTCSWWVITNVGKPSATGQPTRPTEPFILSGSINE